MNSLGGSAGNSVRARCLKIMPSTSPSCRARTNIYRFPVPALLLHNPLVLRTETDCFLPGSSSRPLSMDSCRRAAADFPWSGKRKEEGDPDAKSGHQLQWLPAGPLSYQQAEHMALVFLNGFFSPGKDSSVSFSALSVPGALHFLFPSLSALVGPHATRELDFVDLSDRWGAHMGGGPTRHLLEVSSLKTAWLHSQRRQPRGFEHSV